MYLHVLKVFSCTCYILYGGVVLCKMRWFFLFLFPGIFRPRDDTLETEEFINFFLRSLGKVASVFRVCL